MNFAELRDQVDAQAKQIEILEILTHRLLETSETHRFKPRFDPEELKSLPLGDVMYAYEKIRERGNARQNSGLGAEVDHADG